MSLRSQHCPLFAALVATSPSICVSLSAAAGCSTVCWLLNDEALRQDRMKIDKRNKPILRFPESHPARRFLLAFAACREDCVGREIDWGAGAGPPIDQEWYSEVDGRVWKFSGFAYEFLALDLVLEEWLDNPPGMTESEKGWLDRLKYMERLLHECKRAAVRDQNVDILELASQTEEMFALWRHSILARVEGLDRSAEPIE